MRVGETVCDECGAAWGGVRVHVWCTVYGVCVCIGGEVGGKLEIAWEQEVEQLLCGGDNPRREHVKNHLKDL